MTPCGFSSLSSGPFENGHEYRADFDDIHQFPSIVTDFIQFATHNGGRFGAWNLDEFHTIFPFGRHYFFPAFTFAQRAF
jgi:hypothetical protein